MTLCLPLMLCLIGFNYGSANLLIYNGQFLADREDVVVVTINYRTNIFGFPAGWLDADSQH